MTRAVGAAGPRLADSGRLGLLMARLAGTIVVTGCAAGGAGGTSAAGCVGSTSGTTGAATGSVVGGVVAVVGVAGVAGGVAGAGGTTLGGGEASELPDVLGTCTSGSEIGRTDSFAGSQIEAGV
jgi:hypothetical protein